MASPTCLTHTVSHPHWARYLPCPAHPPGLRHHGMVPPPLGHKAQLTCLLLDTTRAFSSEVPSFSKSCDSIKPHKFPHPNTNRCAPGDPSPTLSPQAWSFSALRPSSQSSLDHASRWPEPLQGLPEAHKSGPVTVFGKLCRGPELAHLARPCSLRTHGTSSTWEDLCTHARRALCPWPAQLLLAISLDMSSEAFPDHHPLAPTRRRPRAFLSVRSLRGPSTTQLTGGNTGLVAIEGRGSGVI